MTETTTKSAARLLTEAAGIARFLAADGWPPELLPEQLAALMAGCRRKDDPKRYDVESRLIATGIKGGKLQTVTVLRPPSLADTFMAVRRARETGNSGWATNWDSDAPRRIVRIPREVELREVQAIDRASCRIWLDAIGEPPGEYVRAWLGPEYEAALKVSPGKAAPAADSRPGERIDYFRSLWLELNKPARNDGIWKAIRSRAGKQGCPITSTTGNEEFVFQYSDGCTDRHDKSQFQKNMSLVRKG
jgi:hypothetical protein